MRTFATLVIFLAAAGGCAAQDAMPAKKEVPVANPDSVSDAMIAAAKADAVQRTGKAEKDITVVSAERVTWSDSSMGCPVPGRMYAQVLTPGYRIVLKVGSEQMSYHAGAVGKPVLCPAGRATPPAASPST